MAEAFWLDLDDVQMAEDYFSGKLNDIPAIFFGGALFIGFQRGGRAVGG